MVGTLTIRLHLPACSSLKEKRGRLKPFLSRLHREFNVSTAEMGLQATWQGAVVGCAMLGNDPGFLHSALQTVSKWVENNWRDGMLEGQKIEVY